MTQDRRTRVRRVADEHHAARTPSFLVNPLDGRAVDLFVALESRQVIRHGSAEIGKTGAQALQPAVYLIVYVGIVDMPKAVSPFGHWTEVEEATVAEKKLQTLQALRPDGARLRQPTCPALCSGLAPTANLRTIDAMPSAPTTRSNSPIDPSVNFTATRRSLCTSETSEVPSRTGTAAAPSSSTSCNFARSMPMHGPTSPHTSRKSMLQRMAPP